MTPVEAFNFLEVGLWAVFAFMVALFGNRAKLTGRDRAVLAIALFAFSWSDYVELRTGAWWRPWWLLMLKGTCLACFAIVAWSVWNEAERSKKPCDSSEIKSKDESDLRKLSPD